MKPKIVALFSLSFVVNFFLTAQETGETIQVLGYTEPVRNIDISSTEAGNIAVIHVKEGQAVKAQDPLISLNNSMYQAELEMAQTQADSTAQLENAKNEVETTTTRYQALLKLLARGNSTQDEVDKQKIKMQTAINQETLATEQKKIAGLKVKQIEAQIERRIMRSPIDGIVVEVNRDVAESATNQGTNAESPVLARVVKVDRLLLTIHVPATAVKNIKKGDTLPVRILENSSLTESRQQSGDVETTGVIDYISVETDPSSETVKTRLIIENADLKLRPGTHAVVTVPVSR